MNKNSIITSLTIIVVIISGVFVFQKNKEKISANHTVVITENTPVTATSVQSQTSTTSEEIYSGSGPFDYRNTNLLISFSSKIPLYEKPSNGFVTASDKNDPHFYQDKACADSDSYVPKCLAFEIQKNILPNQKRGDIIGALSNKNAMKGINNNEFDFYKQTDPTSPSWSVGYFAVNKTSDIYFNILSFATSSVFIEKEILPTFILLR